MMTTASRVLLVSAAGPGVSGLAQAQTPFQHDTTIPGVAGVPAAAQASDPERTKVERADAVAKAFEAEEITDPTVFVKSAALGGLTTIELAKLAQSKSQAASIQSFAGRMLEDYAAINMELAAIAKRKRLDVPTSLVYEDEQMLNQAGGKTGSEFDAWYARQMITEDQKALSLFQGAEKMPDAELAAFAKKTLPALVEHQRMAMAMALGLPAGP
jgi:predicted outer membrane protein